MSRHAPRQELASMATPGSEVPAHPHSTEEASTGIKKVEGKKGSFWKTGDGQGFFW